MRLVKVGDIVIARENSILNEDGFEIGKSYIVEEVFTCPNPGHPGHHPEYCKDCSKMQAYFKGMGHRIRTCCTPTYFKFVSKPEPKYSRLELLIL